MAGEIKNVELVRVGRWAASTGVTDITAEDLSAMVAAHKDQLVDQPPIKLGHESSLNEALGDGAPAYGWLSNVGIGDGSEARPHTDALYADLVGMPSKLAEVAPTAYRRRSVEIAWGVKTAAGKAYKAVLTGLALLGVKPPAVKGLADVLAMYSDLNEAESVSALIVHDGLSAEQTSAFSEALDALASLESVDTDAVPHTKSDPTQGVGETAEQADTITEGKRMTIKKADVEKALEQAGDEDVADRLRVLLGEGKTETKTEDKATEDAGDKVVEVEAKTAAAAGDEDTVVLSKETFSQLSEGAKAGLTAAQEIAAARRKSALSAAVSAGKIAPAELPAFTEQMEKDEAGTTALLSAMQPRFATTEQNLDLREGESSLAASEQAEWDAWSDQTFGTSLSKSN